MNEVRFQATVDDVIAAQRLYQRAALPRYAKLVGIAAATVLFLLYLVDNADDMAAMVASVVGVVILLAAAPAIAYFWTIPRMAAKAMRHDATLAETAVMRWDDTMISAEAGSAQWSQPIATFAGWQANDAIVLLFRQTHLFHFIPARAFPDAATRQSLIDALQSNGVTTQWPPK